MRTESSKDNVTETSSLLKQELDKPSKRKLRRTKKRRLPHARKFLKNSSCLEDTNQDSNESIAGYFVLQSLYIFLKTSQNFQKLIIYYPTFS